MHSQAGIFLAILASSPYKKNAVINVDAVFNSITKQDSAGRIQVTVSPSSNRANFKSVMLSLRLHHQVWWANLASTDFLESKVRVNQG